MQIIFDTEIGTCIDDVLALAVVPNPPELRLVGVTCGYGDIDLRARIVRAIVPPGRPQIRHHRNIRVSGSRIMAIVEMGRSRVG